MENYRNKLGAWKQKNSRRLISLQLFLAAIIECLLRPQQADSNSPHHNAHQYIEYLPGSGVLK